MRCTTRISVVDTPPILDDALCIHSFIHVQSVENVGTRKKRKENMRKAIDVETKREKTLKTFDTTYIK